MYDSEPSLCTTDNHILPVKSQNKCLSDRYLSIEVACPFSCVYDHVYACAHHMSRQSRGSWDVRMGLTKEKARMGCSVSE